MGHYKTLHHASSFRKLAAAMWGAPRDPTIFGSVDIDATKALAFLSDYNARNGCKATITHLVTRAVAITLARHPEFNAKVGWARILLRQRVDIFCQVSTDGGRDLSGHLITAADMLPLSAIATRLTRAAADIRQDRDPSFRRSRGLMKALPLWALRYVLRFLSFLVNTLNLDLPQFGMPRDPFGSAMVTSVGMLGVDTGFAPFTPVARCPIIITVTRVKRRPWVVEDRVEPRPVLRLCGSFDHRVIDGYHAGEFSTEVELLLENPEDLLTLEERAARST